MPYTDFIGLSAYPYTNVTSSADGNTDPAKFPVDYFTRFINLDVAKPLAFAEDYDAGIVTLKSLGLYQPLFELWRETGLIDDAGRERQAYQSWLGWMKMKKA